MIIYFFNFILIYFLIISLFDMLYFYFEFFIINSKDLNLSIVDRFILSFTFHRIKNDSYIMTQTLGYGKIYETFLLFTYLNFLVLLFHDGYVITAGFLLIHLSFLWIINNMKGSFLYYLFYYIL